MFSPQEFAKETGISYEQVLKMCKSGELDSVKTIGGHFKIYRKELDKFNNDTKSVSLEEYERVLRENERLKTMIEQFKRYVAGIEC